jgi:N-acetylglucosamine malate deacetylase 1
VVTVRFPISDFRFLIPRLLPSPLDLLAFGPHPDDIEIGMGGTVAAHVAGGARVGLCDVTLGEMGSNGTVDERLAEASEAGRILGVAWRENLQLPDRGLRETPEQIGAIVDLVRRTRPRVVAVPYWRDRHPDHGAASELLTSAIFNAGLRRWAGTGEPWRPVRVYYYFINDGAEPSFVVDVSEHYETKRLALACYATQFRATAPDAVSTRLMTPTFAQLIESRDAQFGARAGVRWAEGFVVRDPLLLAALP